MKDQRSFRETHFGCSAELCKRTANALCALRFAHSECVVRVKVKRVGLARTGGKQAVLKRADHRFIDGVELTLHNGRTSFPQLRALREYHECAERCKSFSKDIAEKFLQPPMCDRLTTITSEDRRRYGGPPRLPLRSTASVFRWCFFEVSDDEHFDRGLPRF
jgi:hypothetical protein